MTTTSTTTRLAAFALVPLALLTACGGGSKTTDKVKASGLSKADYVAKSEALCAKANKDLEGLPAPTGAADLASTLDAGLGIAKTTTESLQALGAAQPDAAELNKIFLGPIGTQITELTAYLEKLKVAAPQGDAALQALGDPKLTAADLEAMKTYGFKDCVETADQNN